MGRSKSCLLGFFYFAFLFPVFSFASLSYTESFNSTSNKFSSDMVWNIAIGKLHPPVYVKGFDRGSGAEDFTFSVGDGSDGRFTSTSDYSKLNCTTISGSIIYLDTDACDDLQFTVFELQSGWTLYPLGSKPLVIRSQSTITVDGVINCSGSAGTSGDSDSATVSSGGSGRCGGGNGGESVPVATSPTAAHQGMAGGSLITGGAGGSVADVNGGKGGGGGGAYVKAFAGGSDSPDGTNGLDGLSASLSNVGTNYRDDGFIDDLAGAGSGGGGGSAYVSGSSPANSSGGAGGGGGGNIQIYAHGNILINGSILANGGDGGSVASPFMAGAGGGGGGGSIIMMTAADIINDGTVAASNGSGALANTGANGGDGFWGRTWLVEKDGFAGGGNVESPDTKLNSPGDVRYETGVTYTVSSVAIDILNSRPSLISSAATTESLGGSTLSYQLSFGDSSGAASLSSFALPSTYVAGSQSRYFKFEIQIDNTSETVPVMISELVLNYDGYQQTEFEFEGGGCARLSNSGGPKFPGYGLWVLVGLPLFFLFYLRQLTT